MVVMEADSDEDITRLLQALRKGGDAASDRLIAAVYKELRRLAASYLRKERPDHSLQPTALVHEAYLRLVKMMNMEWESRSHFFATAARIMRHILVDDARRHQAEKHGCGYTIVGIDDAILGSPMPGAQILALDEALERLAVLDPRQVQIIEMRFFGGMTEEEIAEVLNISARTVKRDWRSAKAWLFRDLSLRPSAPPQPRLPVEPSAHAGTQRSL